MHQRVSIVTLWGTRFRGNARSEDLVHRHVLYLGEINSSQELAWPIRRSMKMTSAALHPTRARTRAPSGALAAHPSRATAAQNRRRPNRPRRPLVVQTFGDALQAHQLLTVGKASNPRSSASGGGQDLYIARCSACHRPAPVFPPLKESGVVNKDDAGGRPRGGRGLRRCLHAAICWYFERCPILRTSDGVGSIGFATRAGAQAPAPPPAQTASLCCQ
jgi:mono/diheme cytochrome c family protein